MPLQGTFDVLDFSEVLRLLARQQLTGRLHVRSRSFAANLFLEEGALVGADQSEHQAAAASGDVRGRLEEICFEMLDAERGGFEFQLGRASSLPSTNRLRVDTVLSRARKRLQEWQEMQELIPSLDLQPRLVEDLSSAEVTIDQERWKMLTVVDGRRSLRAIGRTLNMSDFDVCRVIKSLLEEGVLELDPRAIALASAAREAIAPPVAAIDTPAVHEVVRIAEHHEEAPRRHKLSGDDAEPTSNGGGPATLDSDVAAPTPTDDHAPPAAPSDPDENPSAPGTPSKPVGDPAVEDPESGDTGLEDPEPEETGLEDAELEDTELGDTAAADDPDGNGGKGRRRRVVRIRSRTPRDDG